MSVLAAVLVAAGCGAAASPSPQPSPTPPDHSTEPATGFRLRVTTVQALPPLATFSWTPGVVITDDLVAIQGGAVPLIFPGPLVTPLVGAQLTGEAWAKIVSEAEAAGLLSGKADFTGGALAPGAAAGRLELVVEGRTYDLTGDPSRVAFCGETLCRPDPGTPEAFATFLSLLGDLPGWLGAGVGAQRPWTPSAYAFLIGPPPPDDQGLAVAPIPWPFQTGAADIGRPLRGDPDTRCARIEGAEAAAFAMVVANATALTSWRDAALADPVGLTVRPLLPGDDDPCAPLVKG
ncbi:MAG: hypothetical protein EPO36_00030 [Chloroflexota bacterium]|nr:MAG: hypothetical protein EPO36_00030 [Chloroflexota bacterium]